MNFEGKEEGRYQACQPRKQLGHRRDPSLVATACVLFAVAATGSLGILQPWFLGTSVEPVFCGKHVQGPGLKGASGGPRCLRSLEHADR